MSVQNSKTWDEIVAERKGISLEEQIAEREAQEKEQTRESLIEDIKDYTFKTFDTLVLPALTVIIVVIVIIKIIKKELPMKKNLQAKCPSCNNSINDEDIFCKHCGEKIIKDDIEKENDNQFSSVRQLPMRWFNFLVKFLMPFWIFFGTLSNFGRIDYMVRNYYENWGYFLTNPVDGIPNTIIIILDICITFFLFITWKELKKYTDTGYKYTIALFTLTILLPIITMLIYLPFYIKEGAIYDFHTVLVGLISSLIFCVPNIIYFKKRKELFNDEQKIIRYPEI